MVLIHQVSRVSYRHNPKGDKEMPRFTGAPPPDAEYGIWMRSPSISGGKDWLIFQTRRGIVTLWGKTGQVNQESPPKPFTLERYWKIADEKQGKGYSEIGTWGEKTGWNMHGQSKASQPSMPTPPPIPDHPPHPTPKPVPQMAEAVQQWITPPSGDAEWF